MLVAHTTAGLAAEHLEDPAAAVPAVVAAVRAALGIDAEPAWTEVQRWTFARPAAPREEAFGLVDGIGLCGDGWSRTGPGGERLVVGDGARPRAGGLTS